MKLFQLNSRLAVAVVSALLAASTRAGTITVGNLPATGTDAATGITTNKHYLCAFDFGNNGTTPTINGVLFTHYTPPTSPATNYVSTTDANFGGTVTLTTPGTNGPVHTTTYNVGRTSSSGQGNLAGQADGNMFTLLTDLIYETGPVDNTMQDWFLMDFGGLTAGDQYSLRIYYRFWSAPGRLQNFYFNGEGTRQAYSGNPLDQDAGGAHYLEYDFTASGTDVFCSITNAAILGNESMMIEGATLEDASVPFAPFITYQPKAVAVGSPTVFTVTAIGTATLAYQWYHNTVSNYTGAIVATDGSDYSGSTTTNLLATNNILDYYFVVVTNNYGSVTSSITQINPKPTITAQPAISASVGVSVVYSMAAGGFPPLAYQWYFNTVSSYSGATAATDGNGYSGSTTNILTATTNLQDYYFVIVTNNYGSVTSAIAAYNPLPAIVAQPSPFKVGSAVGFNMTASGWPTLGYQWYYNTVSNSSGASILNNGGGVSGSTTASVTVANLTDYYFVVVTNYYGSVTSLVAELAPPLTVLSAGEPIWNQATQTNVVVLFSDVLDAATATAAGNYQLDNGANVLSAALGGSNEVVLTTSVLTPGTPYTLMVQAVQDYFGITMSPSPTYLAVGVYPANLALWVRADTGVTANPDATVSQWNDLSGNANNLLGAPASFPEPQLATNAVGDPVIRFAGTNRTTLYANSTATLAITRDMSIVAVVNFATLVGDTNGDIVSKTGAGTSANIPAPYDFYVAGSGGAKLYRGNGTAYGQFTATTAPSVGTPHILAVTETGNTVSHFRDGAASGTGVLNNSFNETSATDAAQFLFLGTRGDGLYHLTGDLSELIIAGSPISSYDVAALNNYLIAQHHLVFVNTQPTNLVVSATGNNQVTLSWPADHIGWGLQSNSVGLLATRSWFAVAGSTATNQIILPTDPTKTSVFYRMVYPPQ